LQEVFTNEGFREKISIWVAADDQPFTVVECPKFRQMIEYCGVKASVPSKVAGRNLFGISRNVKTSLSDVSTIDETFRHRRNVETKRNIETLAIRFNQSKCDLLYFRS